MDEEVEEGMTNEMNLTLRGRFRSRLEFFLSIMGYTVGIGSVWRFPILCSRNGGGVFLIPFFIFLLFAGWPLYYLEVCLGQFTGKSAGLAFEYCPLLKGLGFLQVTLSLFGNWYVIMILAWVFYYFYNSFFPTLPWTSCGNWWNTESCRVFVGNQSIYPSQSNAKYDTILNSTVIDVPVNGKNVFSSASYEFWRYNTLRCKSEGIENMGGIQLHLVICLFLAWCTTIMAICKGAKTLGKVVYVTATVPYLLLTIMLIRAVTLDGSVDGIVFFLKPDLGKLLEFQVWLDAAQQVFFSLGPTWGGVITMASYNKFHQKSFLETAACVLSSAFSSVFNGLVVFTILGFMAKASNQSVQEVASQSGAGLIFVVFPAALSEMPLPHLWSVLFFLAMFSVVFDSMFGGAEVVSSAIVDLFPESLLHRRVQVNVVMGLVMFLLALPFTTSGGIYLFQLCDWYLATFALIFGACLEAFSIAWIYGIERFSGDISLMTGKQAPRLFRILWKTPIPLVLLVTFILTLTKYKSPNYGDGYVYPESAVALGILGGLMPIIVMVVIGARETFRARGSLRVLLRPSEKWQPNDEAAREVYHS